jgi:hypothetical protein
MSGMKLAIAFVSGLALTGPLLSAPPDWKITKDKTGVCQLLVPPQWTLLSTPGHVNSPESTTTAVLIGNRPYRPFGDETLRMLNVDKVYENTSKRSFYVTRPNETSKLVNYHVEVPGIQNACVAQITLSTRYPEEEAKQIALTLAPVK